MHVFVRRTSTVGKAYPLLICLDATKLACENIRFSSLFADGNVSRGGTSRNVPGGEERGETDVFACYYQMCIARFR